MKLKKFIVRIAITLAIAGLFDTACTSGGDPEPVDCTKSTLDVMITTFADASTCAASDGTITVTASGGTAPYQYAIDGGVFQSSATFSNLSPGSHLAVVKDKNGCEKSVSKTLTAPGAPTAMVTPTEDSNCLTPNGSIAITNVTGGTGPYQYKLNSGDYGTNTTFENLSPGSYTVTIKDNTGCEVVQNVTVKTGIDYVNDIKPIFVTRCQFAGCHPDNGDWFTYSVAKGKASTIKTLTSNGTMPKSPQPGGDLTAQEKAMIACWADGGAPEN